MSKVLNSTMLILFLILSLLSPEANSARVLGVGRDPNARMTQADFDDLPLCYAGYNGVIAADFALTAGERCREGLNIYRYDGGCTPQNDRKGLTRVFYGKGCLKALGKVKIIADTSKEKNRKSYEWKKVSDSPINDKPDTDSPADRASETPSRRNRSSSNITVTTTTVRIKCEQVDRQLDWFAAEDVTAEDLKKRLNEAKKELDDVSKKVWEGMSTCHDQCFDAVMTDKGACSLETVFIKDKMKLCEVLDKGDLPLPSSVSGPPVQSTFSKDKFFNALSTEERATCQKYAKNDASLLCKRIYSNEGCAEYLKGTDFGAFCDQSARWLDDLKVAQEAYDYAKKRYDLYVNGKDTLCSFTSEKATEKEVAKLDVTTLSGSCLMELLSSCGEYEERIEQRKSTTCVNCDLRQQQLCAMGYCPGGVSKAAQIIGAAGNLLVPLGLGAMNMSMYNRGLRACVDTYAMQVAQAQVVGLPPQSSNCGPGGFGMPGFGGIMGMPGMFGMGMGFPGMGMGFPGMGMGFPGMGMGGFGMPGFGLNIGLGMPGMGMGFPGMGMGFPGMGMGGFGMPGMGMGMPPVGQPGPGGMMGFPGMGMGMGFPGMGMGMGMGFPGMGMGMGMGFPGMGMGMGFPGMGMNDMYGMNGAYGLQQQMMDNQIRMQEMAVQNMYGMAGMYGGMGFPGGYGMAGMGFPGMGMGFPGMGMGFPGMYGMGGGGGGFSFALPSISLNAGLNVGGGYNPYGSPYGYNPFNYGGYGCGFYSYGVPCGP